MAASQGLEAELASIVRKLSSELGGNLHACILYGSAARGDWIAGVSDLNLLIVLEESTPPAHAAIAEALEASPFVSPFVIGLPGMQRTFRAFATKFLSIRRNYRLLHGTDVLAALSIDAAQERFLVEQALRNHRLRLVHAYISFRDDRRRFTQFIVRSRVGILVQLSEALRLNGVDVPKSHSERLPILERQMGTDASVLRDLAAIKQQKRFLRDDEVPAYHTRLYGLLTGAISWIEQQWPSP